MVNKKTRPMYLARKIRNIRIYLKLNSEIRFALILLAIYVPIIIIVSLISGRKYSSGFLDNILAEGHGLAFDIIIFGILIVIFNKLQENKRDIKRWNEEIDDFRHWKNDEAKFRIVGNIKRLNSVKFTIIDLSFCHLPEEYLYDADLRDADLFLGTLSGAQLLHANLSGALLSEADLRRANLFKAELRKANLNGADLSGANLCGAVLIDADLKNTTCLTLAQLSIAKTLYHAKLDPELEAQVEENFPNLLEEPKEDN